MVSDVNFKIKTSFKMRNSINDFLTCVGDAESYSPDSPTNFCMLMLGHLNMEFGEIGWAENFYNTDSYIILFAFSSICFFFPL